MEDRDYLAKLTGIATQAIPMSPTPSIVTADEDQTIYLAGQPQMSFPPGMQNPDPQMSMAPPTGMVNPDPGMTLTPRMNVAMPQGWGHSAEQAWGLPAREYVDAHQPTAQAPETSPSAPPRPPVPPVPGMEGAPLVPPLEGAGGVPELDAPGTLVPPEANRTLYEEGLKTLSGMSSDPRVQSGVGPVSEEKTILGETMYGRENPDRRGGSYRGDGTPISNRERNEAARRRFHSNRERNVEMAGEQAVKEGRADKTVFGEIMYANPNPDRRGAKELPTSGEGPKGPTAPDGRFNPDLPDDSVLPGQENMVPHDTPEAAASMETAIEAIPSAATGTPTGVETPDGSVKAVTQEDAKRVAAEDPVGFSKAVNWFEKTFGITGQDLARFALFYVGSRLAGYKHGESMSWAFQASASFLENRVNAANQLASGGKYTPESIEQFRKTGDASVLKLNSDPDAKSQSVNFTKAEFLKVPATGPDGKPVLDAAGKPRTRTVQAYPAKDDAGNQYWVDRNGKRVDGVVADDLNALESERKDSLEASAEKYGKAADRYFTRGGRDLPPNIDLDPVTEGMKVAEAMYFWADRAGVDPDSGAALDVISAAARDAEKWSAQHQGKSGFLGIGGNDGASVTSLTPFINRQMLYKTGEPWATALLGDDQGKNALDPVALNDLNGYVINDLLQSHPEYRDAVKAGKSGDILADIYQTAYQEYQKLPPEQREQWESNGGFGRYMLAKTTTSTEQ